MSKKAFSLRKLAIMAAAASGFLAAAPVFAASETAPVPGMAPGATVGSKQECDMGPGMMGGHGQGHGMGPGMMGGHGQGCDMGPGMMGGHGQAYARAIALLDLNAEQREQIYRIQDDTRHLQWEFMGKIRDEQIRLSRLFDADTPDDAAMSKSYKQLSELRQQMFDNSLATRKQLDAVLSKEQREQLRGSGYGRRAH